MQQQVRETSRVPTGISGLDNVLRGGLAPNRIYLIEGVPGAGKTTLGLQFLLEGVRRGERTLCVALSENMDELREVADSHGWSMDGITIHENTPAENSLSPEQQLTMFHPSELELSEATNQIIKLVDELKPARVVIDSLSEMRLMAQHPLRYRRQILGLKQYFSGRNSTVLLLDDLTSSNEDLQLESVVHGVIRLNQLATDYGAERRQLRVLKMRGVQYRGGLHDFVIRRGGLDVFPRLIASEHHSPFADSQASSGIDSLDRLLGGGLPRGSSTLLLGPAGCGKSTIALQFCLASAARGERCAIYIFDETVGILRTRLRGLGMPIDRYMENNLVTIEQIDPAELSPGEFATRVYRAVSGEDGKAKAKVLLIDSLNGYLNSMAQEKQLSAQLHELFTYMNQQGVSTMVTVTQSGMIGANMRTPVDATYLADNVLLFRYFENCGQLRRAMSVVKKRAGAHELSIRELTMTHGSGLSLSDPLSEFQGILSGTPFLFGQEHRPMVEGAHD